MADLSPVKLLTPVPGPGDIETIIVNLVTAALALETAEVDLVRVRKSNRQKQVDAFATRAASKPIVAADALNDSSALEASKTAYEAQAAALELWEKEIQYRLEELVVTHGDEVFDVFKKRLAELQEQVDKEKADVHDVQRVISQLEHRRDHLKAVVDKPPVKRTGGSKTEAS